MLRSYRGSLRATGLTAVVLCITACPASSAQNLRNVKTWPQQPTAGEVNAEKNQQKSSKSGATLEDRDANHEKSATAGQDAKLAREKRSENVNALEKESQRYQNSDNLRERKESEKKMRAIIDGKLSVQEMRYVAEFVAKPNTLLDELMTLKKAQIFLERGDFVSARQVLDTYQKVYPRGALNDEAKSLSARLGDKGSSEKVAKNTTDKNIDKNTDKNNNGKTTTDKASDKPSDKGSDATADKPKMLPPRGSDGTSKTNKQNNTKLAQNDATSGDDAVVDSGDPVRNNVIGVVLPLSGDYQVYGKRTLSAIKLGLGYNIVEDDLEETVDENGVESLTNRKKKNGATGRLGETTLPIQLVICDSAGKTDKAVACVNKLVKKDQAMVVLGDILVDTAEPVAKEAQRLGVTNISLSRRDGIPQLGPWVFRLALTVEKQAEALAKQAREMGIDNAAIIYPQHPYGTDLMNYFWTAFENNGGTIVWVDTYKKDQTTFTQQARHLKNGGNAKANTKEMCEQMVNSVRGEDHKKRAAAWCAKPPGSVDTEAILLPDDFKTISYIVPALVQEGVQFRRKPTEKADSKGKSRVQLLGGSMWNDAELSRRLGRNGEGAIFVDGFNPAENSLAASEFTREFNILYASAPSAVEAHAHDAGELVGQIIAGKMGNIPTTRSDFQRKLDNLSPFNGVIGSVTFNGEGESTTPLKVLTLKDGKIQALE